MTDKQNELTRQEAHEMLDAIERKVEKCKVEMAKVRKVLDLAHGLLKGEMGEDEVREKVRKVKK